jgi:hypothetical protein
VPLDGDALERAYEMAMRRGDEVHELDEHDLIAIAAQARRTPDQRPSFRLTRPPAVEAPAD